MADDCALAMLRLREELSARWPDRIFFSGAENMSILSLSEGLTVWCLRGTFTWNEDGQTVRYPLHDVRGAADHLLVRAGRFPVLERPLVDSARRTHVDAEDDVVDQLDTHVPALPGQLALLPQPADADGSSCRSARLVGTSGGISTRRMDDPGVPSESSLSHAS